MTSHRREYPCLNCIHYIYETPQVVDLVCFFCVLCFVSLPYYLSCFLQPCGHLLGNGRPLDCLVYDVFLCSSFVTFPYGVLGQVWYLIVSIPDLCLLSYFFVSPAKQVRRIGFMTLSSSSSALSYFWFQIENF